MYILRHNEASIRHDETMINNPIIENKIGQPDWRVATEGGYLIYYDDYQARFGVPYDYEEYSDSPINSYTFPFS
ncbi:hypothetical protein AB3U99_21310 [Niallia sp. JL1B1071]|uniref:hypothetical protein n=1 Tax=Niallia tiangongensis TaxID=3237105 RepID=UPI0037DCECD3